MSAQTGHTPAPWTATGDDGKGGTLIETQWGSIAKVLRVGCAVQERENARLITAAPELLDALKCAVSHVEHEFPDRARRVKAWDDWAALIAKAEGRTL